MSIIGPSGSGKTSLMMLMAGLETPTAGNVVIHNQDITHFSEDRLAGFRRDTLGIVFQNFHLVPTMTAIENVALPLEFAGHKDAFAYAKNMLESVGLGARTGHFPSQLSGGEQQRVALARALVMKPKILLADEPTGNLDQDTGQHIIDLMFELHKEHNTTLILITHDSSLAERCERQIVIKDGALCN